MKSRGYFFVKRIFDIVCALLGIIGTSPIWIIAVAGILISDPGPIFYIADRVGYQNRHFRMFKFRSMTVKRDADESSFKADTSRIFGWGAIMRRTKIDELPQLINLLIGDMSVVGPRPASGDQVHIVRAGAYAAVAGVKPGLTSPSALYDYIYGDSIEDEAEYEEKVLDTRLRLELYYINNMSFAYDIKMIFYTVVCIFCSVFNRQNDFIFNELIGCAQVEIGEGAAVN